MRYLKDCERLLEIARLIVGFNEKSAHLYALLYLSMKGMFIIIACTSENGLYKDICEIAVSWSE